jgi:hypothetical protein
MSKIFAIGFGAAALVIAILVWGGFAGTKGNHLAPSGWISGVRVQSMAPELTLMVVDFGLLNDSDQQMVAGGIDPWITTPAGKDIHGTLFSGSDLKQAFSFYTTLGPQIHPPLLLRGTIDGHKTVNLMVGFEFELPADVIESRKKVTLRIEDITGPFVEMTAK